MAERTVKVRLEAATASYLAAMRQASAVTSEFGRNIAGVGELSDRNLQRVSRGSLLMAGGIAAGLGLSAKAAVDWESAWAGVTKTVDGSTEQLATLQSGLRDMAKELPASHAEIAGVAEAAGQLGVKVGDVESFTRVMVDLGETTNLTADQAATSLARISNIMGTSANDVDRMGSTIVELGNNSATTESEIVELGTRLAAAGRIAGLSEADVFAFASTLTSVGVEAEAGGTALSKVFTAVRDAVLDGGEALDTFASVSGVTVEDFRRQFEDDAAGAIRIFIEGLGEMNASGRSTTQVFADLELTDQRLMRALLSTASAGGLLAEQLDMASAAWEENTALQTEAEKRYKTTASQMEMLRNKASDLAITAGNFLLPAVNGVVGGLGGMVDGLAALPGPAQAAATGLAGITTAGLGIVGIVGTVAPKIRDFRQGLLDGGDAAAFMGRNLGRITGVLAGVGAAIAVGTYIYGEATKASREYDDQVKELASSLQGVADGQSSVNDVLSDFLSEKITGGDLETLRAFGVTFEDLTSAIEAGGDVLDPFRAKVRELGIDLDGVDLGKLDDGANPAALNELAGALGISAGKLKDFIDAIEDYDDVAQDAARTQIDAIASTDALSAARVRAVQIMAALAGEGSNYAWQLAALQGKNEEAKPPTDAYTESLGDQEAAAERVEEALDALSEAFNTLIGINLSAESAAIAVNGALAELPEILGENGTALDLHTEAGRRNREAIAGVVGDIDSHVQALIEQGATTDEVAWSLNGYRERLAEVMRQAGFTEAQIDEYIATLGLTPDNIDTIVALHGTAEAEAAIQSLTRSRRVPIYVVPEMRGTIPGQAFSGGGQVQYRASGGPMFSPRGTDTVPAMLTPGEFVVRKQAVDAIGVGNLEALNTYGAYAGFHAPTGGPGGGSTLIVQVSAGNIVGDHRELVRVVKEGIEEGQRLTAGAW